MAVETLKELEYDAKKVLVECARRDDLGRRIETTYATKQEIELYETNISLVNIRYESGAGGIQCNINFKILSTEPVILENEVNTSSIALYIARIGSLGLSKTGRITASGTVDNKNALWVSDYRGGQGLVVQYYNNTAATTSFAQQIILNTSNEYFLSATERKVLGTSAT